jgi:NADPH:quinone reductase-like Zn-dependent oxidoreductase
METVMPTRTVLFGIVAFGLLSQHAASQNQDRLELDSARMKAVRLHAHGETSKVVHYEDAPVPAPRAEQLLIEVHAAGVIPGDWKTRNGRFGDLSEYLPLVLGYDVSGVVVSVGDAVELFEPGDEVFGYLNNGGAFAEYAVGHESVFAHKPENVTHVEAAGAPVSALAAWYALVVRAELKEGQTVLIQAGAGGVGHYAVQIAASLGAKVYTTASPRNHEFLLGIGADHVIDYKSERFEDVVGEVDVVFDMIGGEVLERCFSVVKPGGYLVAITEQIPEEKLEEFGIRGSFLGTPADGEALAEIAEFMESGTIKTHVSRVFKLSEAADAMELNEEGHTRGKLVLKVR